MSDEPNPLDDLPTQLQGRLTTVEVLLTLLVAEKAAAPRLLKAAEDRLSQIETAVLTDASAEMSDLILRYMNAAHHSLDGIAENVRRLRR